MYFNPATRPADSKRGKPCCPVGVGVYVSVTVVCTNLKCRAILSVPDTARGKKVRCSRCGQALVIPSRHNRSQSKPQTEAAEGEKQ